MPEPVSEATAPAATILIAAYNAEAFVADAVASALGQVEVDVEVVVVDDGSTDGTWRVVEAWSRRDPRVTGLRRSANRGPSAARNAALGVARGRWVAVLDADDTLHPRRMATLIEAAERRGSDLLADNLLLLNPETGGSCGVAFPAAWMADGVPVTIADMLRRDQMGTAVGVKEFGYIKPIIRRDFLVRHAIRYDEEIWAGEDFLLYAMCVQRGARFDLLPEPLYNYAIRPGSLSTRPFVLGQLSEVNRRIRQASDPADLELAHLLRARQSSIDFAALRSLLATGHYGVASGLLWKIPKRYMARRVVRAVGRRLRPGAALTLGTAPMSPV